MIERDTIPIPRVGTPSEPNHHQTTPTVPPPQPRVDRFKTLRTTPPPMPSEPQQPPRRRKSCFGKILFLLLVLFFAVGVLGAGYLYFWDRDKEDLPVPAASRGNTLRPIGDDVLFLLAGVDDTGAGTPQRTDTLMLFRFNMREGTLRGLSIPRDTRVSVKGKKRKINAAYAVGEIDETIKTIRSFLGVDLDYYAVVDYQTVRAIVDANGGVRYNVPKKAKPRSNENFKVGDHVLKGEEALAFLRHRKGYPNGDIDRIKAQQAFLQATAKQVMSPLNIVHWPFVLHAFRSEAKTNLPALPFVPKVLSILSLGGDKVSIKTIPGEGQYIGDISFFVPRRDETLALVRDLFGPFVLEEE